MSTLLTRRSLIATTPVALASAAFVTPKVLAQANASAVGPWPGFPRLEAKLVNEVVGKSHVDEARVRELVKAHPALVNAWWDWGFGDWESPLGAASHVGRRGIAEFLLENGARIDIFAAAMLGYTDVVRAFVTAQPGVQRRLGPHGITLMAHARAGGKSAADTVAYLKELGDADSGLKVTPLPADRQEIYIGKYQTDDGIYHLECKTNSAGRLQLAIRQGTVDLTSQLIHFVGEDTFFPSGVPNVRIQFAVLNGKAGAISIRGGDLILAAKRL